MKRLLSWLLVLVMVISLLPMSAFAATDVDTSTGGDDFELDMDELLPTEPEFGTVDNPYVIPEGNPKLGVFVTIAVPAGGEVYATADCSLGAKTLFMNTYDGAYNVVYNPKTGMYWTAQGNAEDGYSINQNLEAGANYVLKVQNPGETDLYIMAYLAAVQNPGSSWDLAVELVEGDNVSTHAAGSTEFYYTYTAPADGTLTLNFSSTAAGWFYAVNNMSTYAYGDGQWSDSDPVVNPAKIEVAAGDVLQIMVNTYDPADPWNAPAGTVTVNASFEEPKPAHVYSFAATGGIAPFLSLEDEVFLMIGFDMYQDGVKLNANTITDDILANFGVAVWAVENKPASNDEYTVENADYCLADAYWHTSNKRITVRTAGIPAKNMGDAIAFRPFYKNADGTYTYGRIIASYSPRTYAESNANKASNTESFRNLMVALMNYGAAAQTFFGYKTDDMMNAAWTDAQKQSTWDASWVRSEYDVSKGAGFVRDKNKVTSRTGNLTLEGAITVNLYAKVSFTVAKATAYYWTEEVYNSVDTLTLENAVKSEVIEGVDSQGRWAAGYDGVAAKDLFNTVYSMIVFEDTDGNVHYTGVAAYSAERYAYLNKDKTDTASELARRLACYSKAAQAYFFGE